LSGRGEEAFLSLFLFSFASIGGVFSLVFFWMENTLAFGAVAWVMARMDVGGF
jgi:hypothetical protein